ncbi:MAG: CotS family spore coat protein [Clostridia bacterium]|jgi:CotS family spore coat protein|nr:CotS family spore coat protein [Clostridia bacterium]
MSGTYTRIKRDDIKKLIESEYGINIINMHEGDKGILLYTDCGTKMLKKVKRDDAKLQFAASAYQYLYDRGFCNMSRINKTQSDGCSFEYNTSRYIVQDYTRGNVMEIRTPEAAAKIAEALALLHKAGENFVPPQGGHARVDWGKWMDKFKANSINIKKYGKGLQDKKILTKFDKIYEKCAQEYYEKMFNAYLILRNFGYLEKVQQSMKQNQLIHSEYRRHSLLLDDQGAVFVINLENCAYDIREADIATMLESFTGRNKAELAGAALKAYSRIIKLDRRSIKVIQALILQPKHFYKVIERYYGRKKNFTEAELCYKLERAIKKEARKGQVLEVLEDYRTL